MKKNQSYIAVGDGLSFFYAIPEISYKELFKFIKNMCINYLKENDKAVCATLFMSARFRDFEVNRCNFFGYRIKTLIEENIGKIPDKDILLRITTECLENRHDELPNTIWKTLLAYKSIADDDMVAEDGLEPSTTSL